MLVGTALSISRASLAPKHPFFGEGASTTNLCSYVCKEPLQVDTALPILLLFRMVIPLTPSSDRSVAVFLSSHLCASVLCTDGWATMFQDMDPKALVDDPPLMSEIESLFSRTKQIVDEKVDLLLCTAHAPCDNCLIFL